MARNEDIVLREPQPSNISEHTRSNSEQDAPNLEQNDSRQWESGRKRASVIVGSAILQLPIWGTL